MQREVQVFTVDQTQVPEEWLIEILLPNDTGEWFVTFTKSDGETFTPELPNFGMDISAGDLEGRLNEYFNTAESGWKGYVTVTKVYYDETDAVVGDLASAALGKTVFTVKL